MFARITKLVYNNWPVRDSMEKDNKKVEISTFDAKVDIVINPKNIRNYSLERNDYTELALAAIKQRANVIKYISPSYKDYFILCEEAINQDYETFLLIKDSVNNYKQLGIKTITKHPFLVLGLVKENKYYHFFWELAVSISYEVLKGIREEELFPLIEKTIQQEPLAIFHVDSRISIYNKLCNIAYSKNKETIKYMDINYVDNYLVFEIIKNEPEKIRYLDRSKDYYIEAWEMALKIDVTLIKYFDYLLTENLAVFYKYLFIALESNSEIADDKSIINYFRIYNRKLKESLENLKNFDDKLLIGLDLEYKMLTKRIIELEKEENKKIKQLYRN